MQVSIAGVISIVEPLDYERAHNYILTVVATDLGIPPLSTQATVNISVSDSNDNPPVFTQLSYNAQVKEHAQIGDVVLQVRHKSFHTINIRFTTTRKSFDI